MRRCCAAGQWGLNPKTYRAPSSARTSDSGAHLGDHRGMDEAALEQLLASYYQMCGQAGIEPLPQDEARESMQTMMRVLVPAFEVEFPQH